MWNVGDMANGLENSLRSILLSAFTIINFKKTKALIL
jgi:hypothetical protein